MTRPRMLILGGTGWLGHEIARQALERGHAVTCLARGRSGPVPAGAELVAADRTGPDAYAAVRERSWDEVVELTWQPSMVREALTALAERAEHWTYVSSCSAYADDATPWADESALLREPLTEGSADLAQYGPAKSGGEYLSSSRVEPDRLLIVRPGLIGGPGDPTDRTTYWVSRFALAGTGPVLVPDAGSQAIQVIDARDLAAWMLHAWSESLRGVVNAVGQAQELGAVLAAAREIAGHQGGCVPVPEAWLAEQGVGHWGGPRSLPLWLPSDPAYAGFCRRDDAAFLRAGGQRRPLEESLADCLAEERSRGLDRPRRAGLDRSAELELLAAYRG